MLNRVCTEDYAVAGAQPYTIRKGTPVVISIMGFGRDAKYFPKPELFWPERFEADTCMYDANAFVPFGDGPRQCIGTRQKRKRHKKETHLSIHIVISRRLILWTSSTF